MKEEKTTFRTLYLSPHQALPDRGVTVGLRDDVHDGPAGHGGGDLPHHLGDLLALGVAVPVVEEDAGSGNTVTAMIKVRGGIASWLVVKRGRYSNRVILTSPKNNSL